jgi:pyruvate decarboxylase
LIVFVNFACTVGSVSYGVIDLAMPKDSGLLAQKLWASIGWSMGLLTILLVIACLFRETLFSNIGATHGASLARREIEGASAPPIILFIGDGSLYASSLSEVHNKMLNTTVHSQMTVQELSSMIRSGIKLIIFVINNGGYTIERLQHSKDALV